MATNPRFPDPNKPRSAGPTLVPKPEPPKGAGPGVILAIVTAVLLLGAILYFMPRGARNVPKSPAASVSPEQPNAGQLQFSDVSLSTAPVGGAVSIDAQLTNSGTTDISGVMAEVHFTLTNNQTSMVDAPIMGIAVAGKGKNTSKVTGDIEDLTKAPIKPGETRPVRITVNDVPATWNHQVPQIRVAETTGAGRK